ncbi:MAG: bifunctional phosphopantothenoylcysteine decarboxylase/phosphopantothenate--cysteine ligase CoaBC, partial [Gammaproteobacteria bacterium]|nr:bifunctional phosphopantothenoylcysteine decarboxylase/phosphopantothenate--cysteine ligase CoaBC [Gammaproteobacteria bacterium]
LLGVTGGIAAYKSPDAVRRLREMGAEVRVIMTRGAGSFITPLTLQAVSGHPVYQHLLDTDPGLNPAGAGVEADGMGHIELARWADAVLVAPASANFLARLAQGRADDLLTAICLATEAPVAVAPAMNQQMWNNAATKANLAALGKNGVRIFGPGDGSQACGEVGPGRMLEPADLAGLTSELFTSGELDGLTVVITAGPTWEAMDPVRGLTNRSSGKMGYALATAAMEAGAKVILVSGPTSLPDPERVHTLRVESAQQMHDAVHSHINAADIFIGVAAVADYRPASIADGKIKKSGEKMTLELVRNPDILASVAALSPAPFTVGFAAETEDVEQNGRRKLEDKSIDLVAANRVGPDLGFEANDNSLLLIDGNGVTPLPAQPKTKLARSLIHHIAGKYHADRGNQDSRQAHRR